MQIRLESVEPMLRLVKLVNWLSGDAAVSMFILSEERLLLRQMDSGHVSLISAEVPRRVFQQYHAEVEHGKEERVQFRAENLISKLRRGKDGRKYAGLYMSTETKRLGETYLKVMLSGVREKNYGMLCPMEAIEATPLPKLTLNTKATLAGFKGVLEDAAVTADYVALEAEKNGILVSNRLSEEEASFPLEADRNVFDYKYVEPAKSSYGLNYLMVFISAYATSNVRIEFASKLPLKMTVPFSEQGGEVTCYVAPRMEGT